MKVRVKAFPTLKDEVVLDVKPGTTLRDALNALIEKYEPSLKNLVFTKAGALSDEILVLHNGASVRDLDTRLAEGDLVVVVPPIFGG